jgi:hypothetical protein
MIAAGSAARQANISNRGKAALQMFEQRGHARSSAEQEMLHLSTDNGIEDRIVAVRHGVDRAGCTPITSAISSASPACSASRK